MAKKQNQHLPHSTGKETEARAPSSRAGAGARGWTPASGLTTVIHICARMTKSDSPHHIGGSQGTVKSYHLAWGQSRPMPCQHLPIKTHGNSQCHMNYTQWGVVYTEPWPPGASSQIKAGKGRSGESSASHGKTPYSTSAQTNPRKRVCPEFRRGKAKAQPTACTGEEPQQAEPRAAAGARTSAAVPGASNV